MTVRVTIESMRAVLLTMLTPLVFALSACSGSDDAVVESGTNVPPDNSSPSPSPSPAPEPAPNPVPPTGRASAILTWTANQDVDLAGYRIYYGTSSGKYDQVRGQGIPTRATSHTIADLRSGTRYYFSITAVDTAGNESGFSQDATKQMP